jgi:hypothetical protein
MPRPPRPPDLARRRSGPVIHQVAAARTAIGARPAPPTRRWGQSDRSMNALLEAFHVDLARRDALDVHETGSQSVPQSFGNRGDRCGRDHEVDQLAAVDQSLGQARDRRSCNTPTLTATTVRGSTVNRPPDPRATRPTARTRRSGTPHIGTDLPACSRRTPATCIATGNTGLARRGRSAPTRFTAAREARIQRAPRNTPGAARE